MRPFASEKRKNTEKKIPLDDLRSFIDEWLLDCQVRQHTKKTLQGRAYTMKQLLWFFETFKLNEIGTSELKAFMIYLSEPQKDGRWGNPKLTNPLRPVSAHRYYRDFKAFFSYLESEEIIEVNPAKRVKPPVVRHENKQPIPIEHLTAIINAAKRSPYAARDFALVIVLLDTGLRAAETSNLKLSDVDLQARTVRVEGKGNKIRTIFLGNTAIKALTKYLRTRMKVKSKCDNIFLARINTPLGVDGIFKTIKRLAELANVPNPGVHAFRRTFAVNILKAGANAFAVQAMLGHSDLETTKRYVSLAQADLKEQHEMFSPADRLKIK